MSKALVPSHLLVPAGTGSLDAYIQEVNKIPMLTLEEEQDLANRYRDHDDLEAARRLVLAHLRFRGFMLRKAIPDTVYNSATWSRKVISA